MSIIAVTGITGHSGRFFLKELEKNKYQGTVRCLIRETTDTSLLDASPLSIEKHIGDVNEKKDLLKLTQNADVMMHIFNIHNSIDVLNACVENEVPRLVMVHTTGVYSKYKMASAEYKEIEEKIEKTISKTDVDITILRPTMIFGDICDHNISKFIMMVDRYPIIPEIKHGEGKIQPVNARDLAKAYYQVIRINHLPELYYDLSGEQSITLHELFDLIGENLGKRVHHISCPISFAVGGAKVVKMLSLGKIDYVERVLRMDENRDYDHFCATRDFGYQPECFAIGLKREVDEYIRQKERH